MQQDPFAFDEQLRKTVGTLLAGVDEAGRGPLAGPVVAAAVVLPEGTLLDGLRDSKKLSETQREKLFDTIVSLAVDYGLGIVEPEEIDRLNIYRATQKAMVEAINKLKQPPDVIVVDAMRLPIQTEQIVLTKAEDRSASVAAASVLAKVTRDRIMLRYHREYPDYGFDRHKGYPTREHMEILKRLGPTPIHRRSFSPVSSLKLPY
ncbi:MAG: ribonuclease HII [Nitrospirae bacterium]|nr:ribonuclease HII [Nitrospirota bacterium]